MITFCCYTRPDTLLFAYRTPTKSTLTSAIAAMENWEFLLQRKGDKSWLPLESPTVEILEGQYRLAARSTQANMPVNVAIAYRPLAEARHEPFQQKIAKRVSNDGLLIVMPYTNLVAGFWEVECAVGNEQAVRAVKFDVIPISFESGSDWQYYEPDYEAGDETTANSDLVLESENNYDNILGLTQNEFPQPEHSSPILAIAEQRSTELVQSMFDEFSLFEEDEDETENAPDLAAESTLDEKEPIEAPIAPQGRSSFNQPRILIQLHQPQYLVSDENRFTLTGLAYTRGDIEIVLKDPQTLEVVVKRRYALANTDTITGTITDGAIAFSYEVDVPPPEQIQVLIGEVQIYPHKDFQQHQELWIGQQAIAVSYPASRVLPNMLKAAREQEISVAKAPVIEPTPIIEPPKPPKPPKPTLSLPPLPSNKAKVAPNPEPLSLDLPLSLPPLSPLSQPEINSSREVQLPTEIDALEKLEAEFAQINFAEESASDPIGSATSKQVNRQLEEPELFYSFEEDLPQNYDEIIEKQRTEPDLISNLPPIRRSNPRDRSNRFLNKLQNLSAEAIAAQKESQRHEELILDTFPPSDPLSENLTVPFVAEDGSENLAALSIDLDHPTDPRTIAESSSLAALDLELDAEFDRLVTTNSDTILNEYVWEETVDPNTFPIAGMTGASATLAETAQTIRNLQEHPAPAYPEQEPIPIPEIIVAEGEIISGTPMTAIVRLSLPAMAISPAIAPKFFVKFWIKDLQTRTIIDGPRWLLDFKLIPDSVMIETRTNISIPLSSIDVAFEAIAIESQSQRESHKARITRPVAPPHLGNA
ncbi:hypothetical protein H6F44_20295 [Pseudanabaena sp. FACHB-1277]|uniref:Uncharacterized protein n=2 Tax=Pseudanabaena TaxID=1152 RepID=A0A926UW77_9CYAN|nr:hypothetical protein [Pseudanabaena cinerea FACHB-1277]